MKFFAVIVLIAAVASAEETKRPSPSSIIGQILEAINNLRPEPADIGPIVDTEPISVGPAIIEDAGEPISVGPALIDFPLPDGGAVSAPVVAPSPVSIVEGPVPEVSGSAPLVQIILNINQAAGSVAVNPVGVVAPEIEPTPIHVVDHAPEADVVEVAPVQIEGSENWPILAPGHVVIDPVQVVDAAPVEVAPVQIEGSENWPILAPGHIEIEPVQVVEVAPVVIEPVQIGVPILPEAAVVLPEQLN
ncbi:hypothetical protein PYW07_005944 [Mythimna separata]|uniref:Uncharacterized protein n=1 Tax=Mythimna separata TaxID=271217 RepID=A0AAD7YJR5_MYTSE|nr:hypothetical protein PYW07_005944 [Mythimna separata]